MPYFAQEPLSYLTLPTIRNAYKTFTIKVTFRPDNVDGEAPADAGWILTLVPFTDCVCVSTWGLSPRLPSFPLSSTSLGGKGSFCTPVSLSA